MLGCCSSVYFYTKTKLCDKLFILLCLFFYVLYQCFTIILDASAAMTKETKPNRPNKKRRGFKLGQERCGARSGIGQHPWRPEIYYRTIAYLHPSLWSNLSFVLLPLTFKHCMCSAFFNSCFTHSLCYMWHHPTHHQIHLSPESPGYQELLELSCRALCQDLLRPLSQKLSQ